MAGATTLAAPVLAASARVQEPPPAQASASADAKPKYGMTKEQEGRVKQSVEERERGRGPLRAYPLSYAAEPSFVFRARVKTK